MPKSFDELGQIMLDKFGEEACRSGYGTTDPYSVGVAAVGYRDISLNGEMN